MHKHVLLLTTTALILAYGGIAATAQGPMTPRPDQQHTQQQTTGEEGSMGQGGMMGCGMMGQEGMMGRGMMGQGGMMGRGMMGGGMMGAPVMMRMIFSLMDADGDGTLSLQEFQAAHERIFKAIDANKDGRLTPEEMQAFMQGTRRSVAPQ
jgi:EF hand